jgi:hypothetical protein
MKKKGKEGSKSNFGGRGDDDVEVTTARWLDTACAPCEVAS